MGWPSMTGGWPKPGPCCKASSPTPRPTSASKAGFSGGGSAAGWRPGSSRPWPTRLLGSIRSLHRQLTTGKGRSDFGFATHETAEMWRLLGSLELLPAATKVELGGMLLDLLPKRKMEPVRPAMVWAIGRLGARVPMYGPLNTVVPAETAADWLSKLMACKCKMQNTKCNV